MMEIEIKKNKTADLFFEFIKPRTKVHGLILTVNIFYWFVLIILDTNKLIDQDKLIFGFIIGGLLISVLAWFGFIGFLENNDSSGEESKELNDELKNYLDESITNSEDKTSYILFMQLRNRLSKEVSNLSRRANLNLIIGIITTIAGVVILASFVLTISDNSLNIATTDASVVTVNNNSSLPAVLNYLPKLTLVILIEIFAFFFLKLYRYSLSEVKFFQNELTNCEMKMIALTTAINKEDKPNLGKTIISFANVERNFILKKGERTIDLVRDEMESGIINQAVDKVSSVASKVNPKKSNK